MHKQVCLLPPETIAPSLAATKVKHRSRLRPDYRQQPGLGRTPWQWQNTQVIIVEVARGLFDVGIVDVYSTTDGDDIAAQFLRISRHIHRAAAQQARDTFERRAFEADCLGAKLRRFAESALADHQWYAFTPEQYDRYTTLLHT
jgi:hypothetical protein